MNLVGCQELEEFDFNSINTPKFNNHHQLDKKNIDSMMWKDCIQSSAFGREGDKGNYDHHYEIQDKFIEENINNILEVHRYDIMQDRDHSATRPLTVIVNDGP